MLQSIEVVLTKIITGSSLYELMKYGENIDKYIEKNDIKSIERKVETKTN